MRPTYTRSPLTRIPQTRVTPTQDGRLRFSYCWDCPNIATELVVPEIKRQKLDGLIISCRYEIRRVGWSVEYAALLLLYAVVIFLVVIAIRK
jgi:hypothetical protein